MGIISLSFHSLFASANGFFHHIISSPISTSISSNVSNSIVNGVIVNVNSITYNYSYDGGITRSVVLDNLNNGYITDTLNYPDGAFLLAEGYPNGTISITASDIDGDGVNDYYDEFRNDPEESTDTDGDGVGDNADAFPNDPNETADSDGDEVGDNADAFPNDPTLPIEIDTDGDGVGDNADAFPYDPSETTDTDGDEVGDNADDDDDNDLLLDVKELLVGSDPLVADNYSSIVSHINSLADKGDSFPGNGQLFSLQEIQDLRAGSTLIEIQNGQATLSIEVEQSNNLETWTSGSSTTLQIPLDAESDTKFFRFKMTD